MLYTLTIVHQVVQRSRVNNTSYVTLTHNVVVQITISSGDEGEERCLSLHLTGNYSWVLRQIGSTCILWLITHTQFEKYVQLNIVTLPLTIHNPFSHTFSGASKLMFAVSSATRLTQGECYCLLRYFRGQ